MKLRITFLSFILLFLFSQNSNAANPAPYTQNALTRILSSSNTMPTPIPRVGATDAEKAKLAVDHYRQIYQRAGYNFDDSVMQCLSDDKIQPEFAFSQPYDQTSAYSTMVFFKKVVDMAKKVPPDKFLSGKIYLAVSDYLAKDREIEKKKLEEEQAKLEREKLERELLVAKAEEKKEKERKEAEEREKAQIKEAQDIKLSLLKLIPGHYQAKDGSRKVGELNVSVIDENKIKFSLYRTIGDNWKCNIADIEIPLIYDENLGFSADYKYNTDKPRPRGVNRMDDTRCYIGLSFKKDGSSVEVNKQLGPCRSHCDRGGTFMGRFERVTIQE